MSGYFIMMILIKQIEEQNCGDLIFFSLGGITGFVGLHLRGVIVDVGDVGPWSSLCCSTKGVFLNICMGDPLMYGWSINVCFFCSLMYALFLFIELFTKWMYVAMYVWMDVYRKTSLDKSEKTSLDIYKK